MKIVGLFFSMFFFAFASGQPRFIDDAGETEAGLEEMALENSSFRKDSIVKLLRLIDETPHKDL